MGGEVQGADGKGTGPGGLKQVVVAGGKGGTGKTTLAASFLALSESGVLVDCRRTAAGAIRKVRVMEKLFD